MRIFDRFRSQPQRVADAAHLVQYLEKTNGRNIRGEMTVGSLATVMGLDGEVSYEEDGACTRRGDFIRVTPEESGGEPDRILFIDEDMRDIMHTGRPNAVLVAREGQLLVDPASLTVLTRRIIPEPRSGE